KVSISKMMYFTSSAAAFRASLRTNVTSEGTMSPCIGIIQAFAPDAAETGEGAEAGGRTDSGTAGLSPNGTICGALSWQKAITAVKSKNNDTAFLDM
ncbi:MAG: hypothetical protein LBP76_03885, partial [Treponema sp.]|nr:hypothetical protein [Treponema sp.]